MSILSFVGVSFCLGSCGFMWKYWRVTKDKRDINSAFIIKNSTELKDKEGEYIAFEGRVKATNPFPSILALNMSGKPVNTALYFMEEHKWLEVFEVPPPTKGNFNYFRRKQWVPKDVVIKRVSEQREFKISSKNKGSVAVQKVIYSSEYPLIKFNNTYRPPETVSTKGMILARIYETGVHTIEKYLEDNSKVTVIGRLKNSPEGVPTIHQDKDKPFILTSLPLIDLKRQLRSKGSSELTLSILTFAIGLGCIAAGAQQQRQQQQQL
jgi:hypothetical protein